MFAEEENFLRSGLDHYPTATVAVNRFMEMTRERLASALAKRSAPKAKLSYETGSAGHFYIAVVQRVRLATGEELTASVGLDWVKDGPYLYVCCYDGPEWARRPKGSAFIVDRGYYYFCSEYLEAANRGASFGERIESLLQGWEATLEQERLTAG